MIRNSLLLHYWYNYKLPGLLKEFNAGIFISENNSCSLRTTIPQLMLITQLPAYAVAFVKQEHTRYFKKFFTRFLTKAQAICVAAPFLEVELSRRYPVVTGKVNSILHGIEPSFDPLQEADREAVLLKYAEGQEYFFCECSVFTEPNLLSILKAFSIFKKRLKSGIRLVILNRSDTNPVPDFKNYKYRNEVHFVSNLTSHEEQRLIGSAYAAIYMPASLVNENIGLQSMQCHVPVVCTGNIGFESMYGEAVLYATNDEKVIADHLMTLYKDETLRGQLIAAGATVSSSYNWQESSDRLWATISNYM